MKIKAMALLSVLLLALPASAAEVDVSDSSISIKLNGSSSEKEISVYINDKNGEPIYADSRIFEMDWAFDCLVSPDIENGEYTYLVRTKENIIESGKLTLSNQQAYQTFMEAVAAAGSAQDVRAALNSFDPALNMKLYDQADKEILAQYIYGEKISGNLPQSTGEWNQLLKRLTILTAIRQSQNDLVQEGKLTYMGLLGVPSDVLALYDGLNTTGITRVNSNMLGKVFQDCDDAADWFKKLVYTNHITGSDITIDEAKTFFQQHAAYLGISASNVSNDVIRALLKSSVATPEELKTAYEKATSGNKSNTGPTGGGSGTSSSGGSSGSYVPATTTDVTATEQFTDLSGCEWAKPAITALAKKGVVAGKGDGIFAPQDRVRREELVTMIARLFGYSSDTETAFADVENGSWYAAAVAAAAEKGIVLGVSEDYFGVGEYISRQDMAVIAFRALRLDSVRLDSDIDDITFTDGDTIAEYAQTAVKVLKKNNLLSGYPDGSFAPKGSVTRAETAQILYNILKLKNEI